MIKVIINGCNGRMGKMISDLLAEDADAAVAAGVDAYGDAPQDIPFFRDIKECDVDADVIIDVSTAAAVDGVLDYAVERTIPIVLCTTGLSEEQTARMREDAKKTAVLKSANMSLGINTILKLASAAAKVFAEAGFDIEIVEKHHRQKLDAPSGTALAIADAMNEAIGGDYEYCFDRSDRRQKRPEKEIGISAVRGGTIVGEHEVIFAGTDEVIEIRHMAYSRAVFAKGAVQAAKFLAGKEPGMYGMSDVIG
ncbi:MAG: 4-hydroxy-tetrahydrodipicolinate reductase [Lachnospiraceae bacterium]|nr:4-hydroxy-tetrahydrodipicolinate reductase [Lachnospiraceae bacterium]